MWEIFMLEPVEEWLLRTTQDDPVTARLVLNALEHLRARGPQVGRPLVDRIKGSRIHNLKELRPGSSGNTEVRMLFVFDPDQQAVFLVAGEQVRPVEPLVPGQHPHRREALRGVLERPGGRTWVRARNWLEIKAEAERLNPWLTSPEADALAAEDTARIEAERQGYALSSLRKESGMTQKEVAKAMEVSQARISQIEHGQIDSLELLRSYISAIGGELHLRVDQGPLSVTLDFPGSEAATTSKAAETTDTAAKERDAA